MAPAQQRKAPLPRPPWPAFAVVAIAAVVLLLAAVGLVFEVGGLPARPALGLLALGAGAALVASALAVRILGQRLRDAELLARRARDALRLVADCIGSRTATTASPTSPTPRRRPTGARSTGSSATRPGSCPTSA